MNALPLPQAGTPGEDENCLARARAEMQAMADLLAVTRAEIVALAPPPGGAAPIGEANDILDLVVAETERAAFEIMHQAERAQAAAVRLHAAGPASLAADAAEVNEAATAIVLACVFQDITGQRIRKVIGALREIEARVANLIALLGIAPEEVVAQARPAAGGDALLHGPSSPAQGGLGQGAVDDIFA